MNALIPGRVRVNDLMQDDLRKNLVGFQSRPGPRSPEEVRSGGPSVEPNSTLEPAGECR
jgi:hypothetical protein